MPLYLDSKRIIGKRQGALPRNPYPSGYGRKIPSSWELKLDDKCWLRVYVMCWSNSGTPYVLVKGEVLCLGAWDPNDSPVTSA